MAEINKKAIEQARDYRDRFEFKLTVGDNIICQRYFKIGNFNPTAIHSYELSDTIRECANLIDSDLKSKTQTYLEIYVPRVFNTEAEMEAYFADGKHADEMVVGEGIVVRENGNNYVWSKNNKVVPSQFKFDDGEFTNGLTDEDYVDYKLTFYDNAAYDKGGNVVTFVNNNGIEVPRMNFDNPRPLCSASWTGVYPKFVRNQIDLSNKKRFDSEDLNKLSFEQYLLYKMTEGRSDLVYRIIKDICFTCSNDDNSWYTIADNYKPTARENKTVKE